MKHIQKKYLFQFEGSEQLRTKGVEVKEIDNCIIQKAKANELFITTVNDFVIKAFPYKHKNEIAIIPIPDLSLIYFDSAYNLNKDRVKCEGDLLPKLIANNIKYGEEFTNDIYHYYGNASGCIIFLFTALESFINHILPDDKPYIVSNDRNTIHYSKAQIQKAINFDEKIKKVLPQLLNGKSYFKKTTSSTQHLTNLKNLRDDLIHTKSDSNFENQKQLMISLLRFKYDDAFKAVRDFMNFYKPNYILDCSCDNSY